MVEQAWEGRERMAEEEGEPTVIAPYSETDTPRQRQISHRLAAGGFSAGWRRFLEVRKAAGYSNAAIAYELRSAFDVKVDGSTLGKWWQQAEQESAARERTKEKRAPGGKRARG